MSKVPTLIMGTAGHVDHGKTSLVKALTNVDLDTLPEEKKRGLTINLGFTSFETPSGNVVAVVDVPGHQRFVRTMLSGAHGLDFVLFIVAADDSVMPQTREHLQILRLLGVRDGIIVITKKDLVEPDLLEIVEAEVEELVEGTFLEDAPMHKVSSVTAEGIEELVKEVDRIAANLTPRERGEYFRMYVDRSFSVAGAGTVVTGTSLSGQISPGDELEILPSGGTARVRKIEMHGQSVEKAKAGQRTAINLRMGERAEVERGDLLATPGAVKSTYMVDIKLEVLEELSKPVRHWTRVRFYIGTRETFGRLVFLDRDNVSPGESAYAQVRLEEPVPAVTGDLFIVRDFSATWTLGGGQILDAHPTKHKRKRNLVVSDLELREAGYLEEVVELEVKKAGYFTSRNEVAKDLDAPLDRIGAAAKALADEGRIIVLPPKKSPWLMHQEGWSRLVTKITSAIKLHHEELPQLQTGLSEQELRERMERETKAHIPDEAFRGALRKLADDQVLREVESTYALSEHSASLGESDEAALAGIHAQYADNPMTPPFTENVYKGSGLPKQVVRDYLERLLAEGELIRINREFMFLKSAVEEAIKLSLGHIDKKGEMTVSEFRDLVGTSRKYAIPLLNYFDNMGYTQRDGDVRKRGPSADSVS